MGHPQLCETICMALFDSVSQSSFVKIYSKHTPKPIEIGVETFREGSPPSTCPGLYVMCHMSHVTCHLSLVTCHMYFIYLFNFIYYC